MAGVGFELRRMIEERRGMIAKVRAYSCAGLISSGPWLMTILTLTLLNLAGPYLGGTEGYSLFRALVTYAFAFSLILQGIAQMAVTRRVADLLYTKRYDAVLPAFVATIAGVGLVHVLIAVAFCAWAGFTPLLSFLAVTLFAIIGMTWIALIWLTVVRQYDEVLRAYVYGTLVAMVGVVLLFLGRGTVGILAAYTAGQAFTLVLLLRTIARGMDASGGRDASVFGSLVHFPLLVGVGLFYNAAIWVDKMIFWFQDGIGPHSLVRYHPLYDTCSFLAYLTVVPALAVNLVRLETAFYERYRGYYGAILGGTPLGVIEDKRRRMLRNLEENVVRLLKTQGAITAVVILFAPLICEALKLPPIAVRLFRLTCLGAFFHVLLLINILMQMYFDLRKQALATSLVFLVLNGVLAWWSVRRGVETYGVGYALASFLSLLLGYLLLQRSLDQLDYMTFTSQPIGSDEERREAAVLAEQERAREEAAEAGEEEDEERDVPAPIVVAAGEMAPPDSGGDVGGGEVVAEREAVPADASEDRAADGLPEAPRAAAAEPAGAATPETATDLSGEPRIAVPAPAGARGVDAEPSAGVAEETATDVAREPAFATPATDDATTEAAPVGEATTVAAEETATDVAREPTFATPAPDDATTRTTGDAVRGSAVTRPADADATATEVDPRTFESGADEIEEELEFVGFRRRPGPAADPGATETELGSLVDDVAAEIDAAAREAEREATATDVGELSALEAAVADLAAQVDADPLREEAETEETATDVAGLSALEKAVHDLAGAVEAGALDEEAAGPDEEAVGEREEGAGKREEPPPPQPNLARRERRRADPSDETEAD